MATTTTLNQPYIGSDAQFRAWGQSVSAALAAIGLVKTADTGQIDFTTVTKPTVINTAAGYEIWRFNDALQATAPVFIKIEYGAGNVAGATAPALWITVGTATNGAGTISGQVYARKLLGVVTVQQTDLVSYFSGAANRLQFCLWGSNTNQANQAIVSIERSHDTSGNDTADGIAVYMAPPTTNGSGAADGYVPFSGVVPTPEGFPAVAMPQVSSTAVVGDDVGVFPHFPINGKVLNAEIGLLTYKVADLQQLAPVSVTLYGTAHTYLPLGPARADAAPGQSGSTAALLLRYE